MFHQSTEPWKAKTFPILITALSFEGLRAIGQCFENFSWVIRIKFFLHILKCLLWKDFLQVLGSQSLIWYDGSFCVIYWPHLQSKLSGVLRWSTRTAQNDLLKNCRRTSFNCLSARDMARLAPFSDFVLSLINLLSCLHFLFCCIQWPAPPNLLYLIMHLNCIKNEWSDWAPIGRSGLLLMNMFF